MRFLAQFLDDYYAEHGVSFFRRVILSFIFGTIIGAVCLLRSRRDSPMATKEMGMVAIGIGVAVMIVASFMHISQALWARGFIAKLAALIVFFIGCLAVLAFICFAASRML
jgi:hypothetical protein